MGRSSSDLTLREAFASKRLDSDGFRDAQLDRADALSPRKRVRLEARPARSARHEDDRSGASARENSVIVHITELGDSGDLAVLFAQHLLSQDCELGSLLDKTFCQA